MSSTKSSTGTSVTGEGLFGLPPELRNRIYEYVFADVEGHMSIRIDGGENAEHSERRRKAIKRRVLLADDDEFYTKLGLLLLCRQINAEASPMVYSKMSLSFTQMPHIEVMEFYPQAADMQAMLLTLRKRFGTEKLKLIKRLVLHDAEMLAKLGDYSPSGVQFLTNMWCEPDKLAVYADAISTLAGIEDVFAYHIEARCYPRLLTMKKGASFVSLTLVPHLVAKTLSSLHNLQQITIERRGEQQLSKVVDCNIYAADSEIPVGGQRDYGW